MKKLIFLISFTYCFNAVAGIFGPSNYEECVSDGKTGRTDQELSLHMDLCSSKFPKTPSIFNQTGKTVVCRYAVDKRYGFNIKVNKDKSSEIDSFKKFKTGKVVVNDKEHVEILFFDDTHKQSMLFDLNNLGGFNLKNNEGTYFGSCSEM